MTYKPLKPLPPVSFSYFGADDKRGWHCVRNIPPGQWISIHRSMSSVKTHQVIQHRLQILFYELLDDNPSAQKQFFKSISHKSTPKRKESFREDDPIKRQGYSDIAVTVSFLSCIPPTSPTTRRTT
ncbi:hypothetical protein CDAR_124521 [Caerostris darwini]|uniref:Uncharacterized protein n=1 Tax=Caerostris darwini TaxID=1538125 RepID=A0AAV4RN11_9ARAC|nr:hypothetical protein CDAR_124521 [Caerostris darwini]